ncbi:Glutathione gamma-glutamylcysteinyltransferase [Gammaproteobacteria bacterium]
MKALFRTILAIALWLTLPLITQTADADRPRFAPETTPLAQSHHYFRDHAAPDYWLLSQFYIPQQTNSACSLASVTMVINALRGIPAKVDVPLITQTRLLETVGDSQWTAKNRENGDGVTFSELISFVRQSLDHYDLNKTEIHIFKPSEATPETLAKLRWILSENEQSDQDMVLIYFDQEVLAGDWDGPHVSPIGAYDAEKQRVLVMDVDREWYVPYWVSDEKLMESLIRPAPAALGVLAGETGGLLHIVHQ